MHVTGPCADEAGRKFITSHPTGSSIEIQPQDLFVVSPEKELLGRLPYDATAEETYAFLMDILTRHPELAPNGGWSGAEPEPRDPALVQLRDLEARYNSTTPGSDWWRESV